MAITCNKCSSVTDEQKHTTEGALASPMARPGRRASCCPAVRKPTDRNSGYIPKIPDFCLGRTEPTPERPHPLLSFRDTV